MPQNETIIAVPITVETPGQTRQFLVRLIEKLDIVLGYRGGDPYVSSSQLNDTNTELTRLEQTVLEVIQKLISENSELTTELIERIVEETTTDIDALKSPDTVDDADTSNPAVSAPPTQAEVQALSDRVADNAVNFNDLLVALRGTGIIAT